jgi:hypothetical protein
LTTPVPVDFCRVQITVTPAINIEVWLPPAADWNHRFQAEGGGGYAGVISYSALAMAVTGDAVTGQFATASTDTGHPATGTDNGQRAASCSLMAERFKTTLGGFRLDRAPISTPSVVRSLAITRGPWRPGERIACRNCRDNRGQFA